MMERRVTLRWACAAWSTQSVPVRDIGKHLVFPELYELFTQSAAPGTQDALLHHLVRCPSCLQELQVMAESLRALPNVTASVWEEEAPVDAGQTVSPALTEEPYADEARPWAASSALQGTTRIPTAGSQYTIVTRRHLVEKGKGLITVEVAAAYREQLEGKMVTLWDGRAYILLRGKIVNGKTSQVVEALDEVIPHFHIEAE